MNGSNSRNLNFNSGNANLNNNRANSFSVRCLKDYRAFLRRPMAEKGCFSFTRYGAGISCKYFATILLLVLFLSGCAATGSRVLIQGQATGIEFIGYDGLKEKSLFEGELSGAHAVPFYTFYRGLVLLVFQEGQSYPVIFGDGSFALQIAGPSQPPSFAGSDENLFFYQALAGDKTEDGQYPFATLLLQAKKLLESSHTIRTVEELTAKKKEFQDFVRQHYDSLKHSDMVRRLIAQYFMMHEYVDYHREGAPPSDIRVRYQKEILNGVGNWLETLRPHLPAPQVINYIVSCYYHRSMVTLASLIIENFRDVAYCSGEEKKNFSFPADTHIVKSDGNSQRRFADFPGKKIIAFVSENCPVSMVETISKARQLAGQGKKVPVIVAPLEKLSGNHLAMSRMIREGGNLFFVSDEQWRKENLAKEIKLPFFIQIGNGFD
ncbi:MAG: hypothetical protein P8130_00960 [Deltaproteobacteria bacterium]